MDYILKDILSECCKAIVRYLDCADCREKEKQCIYICVECGEEYHENH